MINQTIEFYAADEFPYTLKHGDIIRVISHEENCGLDRGIFTAVIVEGKDGKLVGVRNDISDWMTRCSNKGVSWELDIEWLLENLVEIALIHRFDSVNISQLELVWRWVLEKHSLGEISLYIEHEPGSVIISCFEQETGGEYDVVKINSNSKQILMIDECFSENDRLSKGIDALEKYCDSFAKEQNCDDE